MSRQLLGGQGRVAAEFVGLAVSVAADKASASAVEGANWQRREDTVGRSTTSPSRADDEVGPQHTLYWRQIWACRLQGMGEISSQG